MSDFEAMPDNIDDMGRWWSEIGAHEQLARYTMRELTRMVYEGQAEEAGEIAKLQDKYPEFLVRLLKVHRRLTYADRH